MKVSPLMFIDIKNLSFYMNYENYKIDALIKFSLAGYP